MFKPVHERFTDATAASESVVGKKRTFPPAFVLQPLQEAEQKRQLAKNLEQAKREQQTRAQHFTGLAVQPQRTYSSTHIAQAQQQGEKGMAFKP